MLFKYHYMGIWFFNMKETDVGKIKNITYDPVTDKLEVTVSITDVKYQKKLLRDLSLAGQIRFENNKLIYVDTEEESE